MALSLSDIKRMQTDPFFRLAKQSSLPSLAETKSLALGNALVNKTAKLDPASVMAAQDKMTLEQANAILDGGSSNLIDIGQSSLYQGYLSLSDFLSSGPDRTNAQLQQQADAYTGVTPEARKHFVEDPQQRVSDAIDKGNYLSAILNGIAAAPGTIADNANLVGEIAGTSLAVAGATAAAPILGGALGLGALGRKIFQGAEVASKLAKPVKQLTHTPLKRLEHLTGAPKSAGQLILHNPKALATAEQAARFRAADAVAAKSVPSLVDKAGKLIKNAAKAAPKVAAQVSVAAADITQRQINAYRELHGQNPDGTTIAGMYGLTLATLLPTPTIFRNFLVPKFGKEIARELQATVSNMGKGSNFAQLGTRVARGLGKLGSAGTAGAIQGYIFAWADQINTNIGPKDKGHFIDAVIREFKNSDNAKEREVSAILAGGAGVGAKAVTTVPHVALGGTVDVAKATAKGIKKGVQAAGKVAADRTAKKSQNLFSDAETEIQRNAYNVAKAKHEKDAATNKAKENDLRTYRTFNDVPEGDLRTDIINEAGPNVDLQNNTDFRIFKKRLIRKYQADTALSKANLEANRFLKVAASETKRVATNLGKVIHVTPEDIAKLVEVGKIAGKKAVEELKNYDTSTTYGLAEAAISYGRKKSSEGLSKLESFVAENTPEAVSKLADILQEDMPHVSQKLNEIAARRELLLKKSGVVSDRLVTTENLSPVIKDTIARGHASRNTAKVGEDLLATSRGRPEDINTIKALRKALNLYEKTDFYKKNKVKGTNGSLSIKTVKAIHKKLNQYEQEIRKRPLQRAEDVVKAAAAKADIPLDSTMDTVSAATKKILKTADSFFENFINSKPIREAKHESTVTDVKTKSTIKVKKTEAATKFLQSLANRAVAISKLEGKAKEDAIRKTIKEVTADGVILKMSDAFNTNDPLVIASVIADVLPFIKGKDGKATKYFDHVAKVLKGKPEKAPTEKVIRPETPEDAVEHPGQVFSDDGFWLVDDADIDIKAETDNFISGLADGTVCK